MPAKYDSGIIYPEPGIQGFLKNFLPGLVFSFLDLAPDDIDWHY